MGWANALAVAGAITAVLGAVFHLQGLSVLGPESSFMHASPEWATYGMQILVAGAATACAGAAGAAVAARRARKGR